MLAKKAKLTRRMDRAAVISRLREQIRHIEADFVRCQRDQWFNTSLPELDEQLAGGGLPAASIVELLTAGRNGGCLALAVWLAGRVLAQGGSAGCGVIVDRKDEFYPPGAVQLGLQTERTVIVRPHRQPDTLWATEQSLRSPAVAVVLVTSLWQVDHRQARRLQLAAEAGGGVGLVVRPFEAKGRISSAAVRLSVAPAPARPGQHRWSVQVLRCRAGRSSGPVVVGLSDETGDVLADAAVVGRAGQEAIRLAGG